MLQGKWLSKQGAIQFASFWELYSRTFNTFFIKKIEDMNQTILRAKAFVVSWISFPIAWKVYLPQWLEITYKKELKNNKTQLSFGEIFSPSQEIGILLFWILPFWLHVSKNTSPKKSRAFGVLFNHRKNRCRVGHVLRPRVLFLRLTWCILGCSIQKNEVNPQTKTREF